MLLRVSTRRARLGDVEIAYEIVGDGPPLVWCHGLTSCREGDRDVIDALARSFTVLAYDARGHGESAPVREVERFSYPLLADDLVALMDHVGWDRAVLAGSSMGAATACRVAMTHPSRVAALVVARPVSDGGPAPAWMQDLFRAGAQAFLHGGIEGAIEFIRSIPIARSDIERNPERLEALRREWKRHDPASIVAALTAIPASAPLGDGADPAAITAPTLVIPGNPDDPIHPTDAGERVARRIPGAHAAPPLLAAHRLEETARLVALVRRFLRERGIAPPIGARAGD